MTGPADERAVDRGMMRCPAGPSRVAPCSGGPCQETRCALPAPSPAATPKLAAAAPVADRVVARCDALDLLADGIVGDLKRCQGAFKLAELQCDGARTDARINPANRELPANWSKTRSRALCPHPQVMRHVGGDIESAASFRCVTP